MTLQELVTLIAAAGAFTVAATAGFVDLQSAEVSPADSKPVATASSGAPERSSIAASRPASPRGSTEQEESRRSQAPKPARCEDSASAHQTRAASNFCPLRLR